MRAYHHRVPGENSPLRGRIHLRRLSLRQLQSSRSRAADHTFTQNAPDGESGAGLDVSPDRRWIVYTQFEQAGSELMLVDGFR